VPLTRLCPQCREEVSVEARFCPHCASRLRGHRGGCLGGSLLLLAVLFVVAAVAAWALLVWLTYR
jgi:hypothetical protein